MTTTQASLPLIEQAKIDFLHKHPDCYVVNKYLRLAKESLKDYAPGIVCYVIARKVTNDLGIEDIKYYYLTVRNYWYFSWADIDHANIAKYKNTAGGGIESNIVKDMLNPKTIGTTLLVIAVLNKKEKELEYWSISATSFKELTDRYSTIHKGRFNHIDYGFAKEWLNIFNNNRL